jgi:uncharacterized damage-inducible protein DinB
MNARQEILKLHLGYASWATGRLLEAASALAPEQLNRDFGTADKSVLGTLTHTFAADRIWYSRVTGAQLEKFIDESDFDMEKLRREWPELLRNWQGWLAGLPPEALETKLNYTDMAGRPHSHEPWKIVLHLVNHGTHHRGQVSGFIRALGHKPPSLDLINYYRSLDQA